MGASAPVKYHYFQRYFTYSIDWKRDSSLFLDPRRLSGTPIQVEDIVRWGVWLGRHIC